MVQAPKMHFWVKYIEFNPLLHKYCWNEPGYHPSFCQRELYRQLLALAEAFIPGTQRPLQLQMLQIITEKEVILLNYVNFFKFNTSIILLKTVNFLYSTTHFWNKEKWFLSIWLALENIAIFKIFYLVFFNYSVPTRNGSLADNIFVTCCRWSFPLLNADIYT